MRNSAPPRSAVPLSPDTASWRGDSNSPSWCYATGSHEWADFVSCDEASPLPGGVGDIDYFKASYWKDFVGVTVRTYDSNTGLWRIYWVDNRFSAGVIQPPVVGKFKGNVGIFEGRIPIKVYQIVVR